MRGNHFTLRFRGASARRRRGCAATWRHQTWVDNNGSVAVMEGGLDAAGDLVLHAVSMPGDPDAALRRMTFRRQADGTVRQIVERSTDGGATWTTAIDLVYTRRR